MRDEKSGPYVRPHCFLFSLNRPFMYQDISISVYQYFGISVYQDILCTQRLMLSFKQTVVVVVSLVYYIYAVCFRIKEYEEIVLKHFHL